jgi:hypothetical protein
MYVPEPIDSDCHISRGSSKDLQDQPEENTVYEKLLKNPNETVIHSENCVNLTKCRRILPKVSLELEETRRQWWKENKRLPQPTATYVPSDPKYWQECD